MPTPSAPGTRRGHVSRAAFAAAPDDATVALSRGPTPVAEYRAEMLIDLVVHGWDLSRGAGLDETGEPTSAARALELAEPQVDAYSGSGAFAPPVPVDSDDPLTSWWRCSAGAREGRSAAPGRDGCVPRIGHRRGRPRGGVGGRGSQRRHAVRARPASRTSGSLASLVQTVPMIISVCPPEAALEVARAVADHGFAGVFVDANAVSARTVRAIAELLPEVVDGAVIGGPSSDGAVLHLAGSRALDAARIFDPAVVHTQLHDGPVGTASTLKACYAASSKAVTALLLATRAAAHAAGLEDELGGGVESHHAGRGRSKRQRSLQQIGAKAWRFGAEMREAADVFDGLGVPSGFSRGAAEVYARLADLRDVPYTPGDVLDRIAR